MLFSKQEKKFWPVMLFPLRPSQRQEPGTQGERLQNAKLYHILSCLILSYLVLSYLTLSSCPAQQRPVSPSIAAVQPSLSRLAFLTDLLR